ncbi:MAG TPA: sulfurtransferase [Oceanospirillales bacterium]|jgi:rhodanese-related sulfurtransferase|nr:sulfurtransferase [Oleispira sp.]HCM04937.1 sulfurtransferase [Oceanospirillales bacterium]|tara:strand:- start:116 stop:502 length:387 start_codon:yes stop_codon:yes gene_type:complete
MNSKILTRENMLAEAASQITVIDTERAEEMLTQEVVVLDVRETAEFQAGHLPKAINVPRGVLEFKVANHPDLMDPQQPILIYCKNGGRSTLAALTLKQMGFTHVEMLAGGFDGWTGAVQQIEIDPSIY